MSITWDWNQQNKTKIEKKIASTHCRNQKFQHYNRARKHQQKNIGKKKIRDLSKQSFSH